MLKKWRTILALIPLVIAVVMQWWWFFTLLFIVQIIFSLLSGSVEYVEEIKRSEDTILYWFIIALWSFLGIYSLIPYLIDKT